MRAVLIWLLLSAPVAALPIELCVNLASGLDAPFEGAWGYTIVGGGDLSSWQQLDNLKPATVVHAPNG